VWAVLAIVAFIVALVFHVAAGKVARYVLDAELLGFIFLCLHLCWDVRPWRR
jgi:hypothetical protein